MDVVNKLQKISEILETDEIYAVGGVVRDILLAKKVNDLDIASPLTPEEVIRRANEKGIIVIPTGIEYGTVTIIVDNEPIEHTTFRKEQYRDDRHPEVEYTNKLFDDLARRDFTINAIAMDKNGKIIDPFGGQEDIKKGIIRAVGDPHERFYEDPLRIMRAARFAARYDFSIDMETFFAARSYSSYLDPDNKNRRVSPERVTMEIQKALKQSSKPSNYFKILNAIGVNEKIFKNTLSKTVGVPQQPQYHKHDVFTHSMETIDRVKEYMIVDDYVVEKTRKIYREYKKKLMEWEQKITPVKRNLIENGVPPSNSPEPPKLTDYLENEFGDFVSMNLDASILKAIIEEEYGTPVEYDEKLLLAAALHDVGKGIIWGDNGIDMLESGWHYTCHDKKGYLAVREELKRLKMSNEWVDEVSKLVLGHDVDSNKKVYYRYMKYITSGKRYDLIAKALLLRKADALSHKEPYVQWYKNTLYTALNSIPTRPLNRHNLKISHADVYNIVKKYYKVGDKTAHIIAGEIMRKLEYDTYGKIQNHKVDLTWRATQLAKSNYREKKKPAEMHFK